MIYYSFTSTGQWTGFYNSTSGYSTIENPVVGDISSPQDIVKIEHSTSWDTVTSLSFQNLLSELTIENLTESDWTTDLKNKWFQSYLKHIGMGNVISSSSYNSFFQIAENNNIFYKLSFPSIAYVTQDSLSDEISIGMNVYDMDFIMQYAISLPDSNPLKALVHNNHVNNDDLSHYEVYCSHVCKVTYQGYSDFVWCFGGLKYNYDLSLLGFEPTVETGGGNLFGEVKLAGNGIKAQYIVKKDIDPQDPTEGLCSGSSGTFCMGDQIHILDTTIWTKNNGSDWTWIGDYTQLNYTWYIADITNPCYDYRHSTVTEMLFPIRVIQECPFGDFGYNILGILNHPTTFTDIVVNIDDIVTWENNTIVTITDMASIDPSGGYVGNWKVVSRGTDVHGNNMSSGSKYYRLRRTGFDNRVSLSPPVSGQIYLAI